MHVFSRYKAPPSCVVHEACISTTWALRILAEMYENVSFFLDVFASTFVLSYLEGNLQEQEQLTGTKKLNQEEVVITGRREDKKRSIKDF